MPPNKQGRKQRIRGKNISNVPRERTVLTLAEDPPSAPPYMLPSQSPITPTLGNMFPHFNQQQGQNQQTGVSIPDMTGFTYQQPNAVPPFGGQGSSFFNHMQQTFQGSGQSTVQQQQHPPSQQQQQPGSGEVSDIEKLRKLKETILSGQHPFFQPVPHPDALGSLYLGPHPMSQAFKEQDHQQSAQLGSLSQPQPDKSKISTEGAPKPDGASQVGSASVLNAAKRPQSPGITSGHVSRVSGSLATSQSISPGAYNPTGTHQTQNTANGSLGSSRVDHSRPHHKVIIPPKTHDFRTAPPSPLPPNSARSSAPLPPQQHQGSLPVQSSSASGANPDQSRAPHSASATASAASLNDSAGINKLSPATTDAKDTISYKDAHPGALSPGGLDRDREREHDRERSGYQPYDAPRYSHPSDRRDTGRYSQRYPDSRYDRDREWARGRDWEGDRERDRERERERDRERDRARDRFEYERPGRPPIDRRPPPPPAASVDQKHPFDQRPAPRFGPPPEQRRSEVPPHPEQLPRPEVPTVPEQRRHAEVPTTMPEQRHTEVPVHPDQRRSEVPAQPTPRTVEAAPHTGENTHGSEPIIPRPAPAPAAAPYSNQFHGRDRSFPSQGPPVPRAGPPGAAPPPVRTDQHAALSADDQSGLQSVPSDQRASSGNSGNSVTRSDPPPPETHRRPDTANASMRPSTGMPMDHGPAHSAQDRRLTTPVMSESRAGHGQGQDDRDVSRPFFPNAAPAAAPRAISRAPSPGPRRPTDSSYDASRERDRTLSMSTPAYREPPPPPASAPLRNYPEDSRRQPLDPNVSRRVSDNFYAPTASPAPAIVERREEVRQWREREGYPPAPYSSSDPERERARRYPEAREWQGDAYNRERDPRVADLDVHTRPRPPPPPPPPTSWDRDRSVDMRDKDKDRDGYENWPSAERKYPGPDAAPPPPRWEDPAMHTHRPLHTRLTDTYDDRFIPRDIAERGRYPPPPVPNDSMNYRDNPRVRQRSLSPVRRPGVYDDTHRAPKRSREEYEAPSRAPYEYAPRPPSPPPYYDPRAPALANPRDPSPYSRDRVPDPLHRRDMPPPRSPPYYPRDRYPPR
ncbi:hypothetical protein JB92DRAFT_2922562 [Gautieria morchelliformis]|nr:hypothetical protein JB92DRAFT_2922562 [Gautieria morchelliformis]